MCSLFKISSKYIIKNMLDFISLNDTISIFKYNKKTLNLLGFNKEEIKIFLLMKKVIKPIANIEDYIPILMKILNFWKYKDKKQVYLINLLSQYLNKNHKFLPNVNFFSNYENIYALLNRFKINFNNNLVESFFHEEYNMKYININYLNLLICMLKK